MNSHTRFIGIGIYSVPDAARLTKVPSWSIRRWIRGYSYKRGDLVRRSPAVWKGQLKNGDRPLALGFLDLMEVRFVSALRKRGVSWKTIRLASDRAKEQFKTSHPFCTVEFKTDGRGIFADLHRTTKESGLLELSRSQQVFRAFIEPYISDVDIEGHGAARWWPMGKDHGVVVDPTRSLGKPIVNKEGVPTFVLAEAVYSEGSVQRVAAWYEVSEASVRDALAYEKSLVA